MTLTTKNSPEMNGPGKSGQSPRSNPVCLEVSVTIRSLPTEVGGSAQQFREDSRTVIVFDNGAVLRSTSNLPVGQSVILTNPKGRDMVCRVAGGRNLPNVKGYVEVEFIEAANDYWGIHQDPGSGAAAAPPTPPLAIRETAAPPTIPPVTSRATPSFEAPVKPASVSLGSSSTFESLAERGSMPPTSAPRDSKSEPPRLGPERIAKIPSDYNLSAAAKPTSIANWDLPDTELPIEKLAIPVKREASSMAAPAPASAPSHDFLSKGLMAYEQPRSSSGGSTGRVPLIVGVAALVLAGVCAAVFFMHRRAAPVSVAKTAVISQPPAPAPPAANTAPEPVQALPEDAVPTATQQTQIQPQPVAAEPAQPAAPVAPVPAVATGPAISDSPAVARPEARPDKRAETRNVRQPEKKIVAAKQLETLAARRPSIPNLKMGSPSAPNQTPANQVEGSAPIAEIAATGGSGATPPAGLLTSNGRTSNPPAPPPAAFATAVLAPAAPPVAAPAPAPIAGIAREPKLISSVRPTYPAAAKESNIQGSVTVSANIDANGKVVGARALSGPVLLRQAAEDSVKQWKYSPSVIDGKPAASQVTVSVDFRLK